MSASREIVVTRVALKVAAIKLAVLTVRADIMTAILQGVIALIDRSVAGVTVDYLGATAE